MTGGRGAAETPGRDTRGLTTPALKALVLRQVTEAYPCTLTFQVAVQDPVYRRLDISAGLASYSRGAMFFAAARGA